MSEFLIFVIIGLTAGAVYALAGVGLVLTYRTSGVFNFAHGALATVAAYVFYTLHITHGWPWPLAALVSVVGIGAVMGVLLEPLARRLRHAGLPLQVASTVGLLLAVQAVVALRYPDEVLRQVPPFLPDGQFELAGAPVQWSSVITLAFALVVTAGLSVALRWTRAGLATRALVDDDQLLSLNGIHPTVVRRGAWVTGSVLAAASGVLFAPLLPLNSVQLTLLVVSAFGAAAVGAFKSLPLTFTGGLLVGVLASLVTRYVTSTTFAGLSPSLPFLVLFVVILLRRRTTAQPAGGSRIARPAASWSAPAPVQFGIAVLALAVLIAVPSFAGIHLIEWTAGLGAIVLFLSLALLVRTSGQVSLCHVAFTAIGACAFSHLAVGQGLPWLVALLAAGLVAVPVGAVLAIPAIRVSGLYLALATFGFGILLQYMFYTRDYMFGSDGNGLKMPRPDFGSGAVGDTGYYYVALTLVVVASAVVVGLTRSRLGRLLRGLGDAPTALETTGAAVNVTRVLVFCISAFLAAIAGALMGVARTTVSLDAYPPLLSLTYLALITITIGREPWNALLAGLALLVLPSYISGAHTTTVMQLVFGVSALLVAVAPASASGAPAWLRNGLDARFRARGRSPIQPPPISPERRSGPGLLVEQVHVRFGGLRALAGVDLEVPLGQITGLIGPNGAGKTTLFNCCSGLVRPVSGTVRLGDEDLGDARPGARARAGFGRTFQDMRLFDSLTVRQNVELGREGAFAGRNPLSHLVGGPVAVRTVRSAADEAIVLCGLEELADRPVQGLSTGQRRLVDLARCLAGDHQVLLLDEPSSGLDVAETAALGLVVRRVVAERGLGVLLVEHDLPLVLDLCSSIYVLDFGELIFHGTPSEVSASEVVQAAYLGDAHLEELLEIETSAPVGA